MPTKTMKEQDSHKRYERRPDDTQPEADYPLERTVYRGRGETTIITHFIGGIMGVIIRDEAPLTPVTDLNEFRKKKQKDR